MQYTIIIAFSLGLMGLGFSGLNAQTLSDNPVPAELPPSSFTGNQYVDSKGCIFIRAGVDGTTLWVPRVTRSRQQICDAQPSIPGLQSTEITPPAPDAEQIVPDAGGVKEPAVIELAAADEAPSAPQVPAAVSSPGSAQLTTPRPAQPAASSDAVTVPPIPRAVEDETRILPSHLVDSRVAMNAIRTPKGFTPVWTDDRLNPRRAEQSVAGYVASQRTVTLGIPRRPAGAKDLERIRQPRVARDRVVRTRSTTFVYAAPGIAGKAALATTDAAASAIFVRVAGHNDLEQARADAQIMARTGLPTRMGRSIRKGRTVQLILAGPFETRKQAREAVKIAKRAGFSAAAIMN